MRDTLAKEVRQVPDLTPAGREDPELTQLLLGHTQKAADTAALLFQDAVKIAVYSQAFGGYQHMTQELTDFITHWEVESYRKSQMK